VKRTLAISLLAMTAALAGAAAAEAQATTVTTNEQVPIVVLAFVPCANDGAGELVLLEGTLHVLTHVTIDDQGGLHVRQHFQPQGVSGEGLTTGDKYQGTGVTQTEFNATAGFEQTSVNNFRVIGQGPDNNLLVHSTFHVTVTPNGDVTSVVDNFSVECR
jgi:opacity protein-like surface antigen